MGAKVDLINEIYSRLNTALSGSLSVVKRVRVGAIEEARKENDLPIINIQLVGGLEVADHPNRRFTDDMRINITLVHSKLANSTNSLFKTSDSTGALYVFETMLNVLDKNTSGTAENTFSSNANFLRQYQYTVEEEAGVIVITAEIGVKTKYFALGAR